MVKTRILRILNNSNPQIVHSLHKEFKENMLVLLSGSYIHYCGYIKLTSLRYVTEETIFNHFHGIQKSTTQTMIKIEQDTTYFELKRSPTIHTTNPPSL